MNQERVILGYIPSWEGKTKPQVIEEIASLSLETKRLPDPYCFDIAEDGRLSSPQTGKSIENSIEKSSCLGQTEWLAVQEIQRWNVGKTEGLSFWISPPHPKRSQFTKLIISEIVKEEKGRKLFNRSLLLDIDGDQALNLGLGLTIRGGMVANFKNTEDLRSHPIFVDTNLNWVDFLDMKINDKKIFEMIRKGEDIVEKEMALQKSGIIYEELFGEKYPRGYDDYRVKQAVEKAQELDIFGSLPGSCPPALLLMQQKDSAFGEFFKNSEKSFPCPECHKPIPSGEGVTKCPHCGITKEEYGSKCD